MNLFIYNKIVYILKFEIFVCCLIDEILMKVYYIKFENREGIFKYFRELNLNIGYFGF